MITFTFNGTEYQAEKDMTWREWIDSPYNEIEKYDQVNGTGISVDYNGSIICSCAEHWLYLDEEEVQASEEIVENGGYYFQ